MKWTGIAEKLNVDICSKFESICGFGKNKSSGVEIGAWGGQCCSCYNAAKSTEQRIAICNLSVESLRKIGNSDFIISHHFIIIWIYIATILAIVFQQFASFFSAQLTDKLIYRSVLEFCKIIEMRHRCRDMEKEIGVQFLAAWAKISSAVVTKPTLW